mmetsp:Transcript_15553/g.19706  ORF Transcript_15553/g.19706 Transcript_15553/m.19706 type:complete len:293 (+) Transcript_15553:1-879(+)
MQPNSAYQDPLRAQGAAAVGGTAGIPSDSGFNNENLDDLQFMTSVDTTVNQNVPVPPVPTIPSATRPGPVGGGAGNNNGELGGHQMAPMLKDSSHPIACVFHCIFKLGALFLYLFGGVFAKDKKGAVSGASFIIVTVFCILLLAADFWVVKNVTGRLLVGLRWWNKVEGDGSTTTWIFESAETQNTNKFDNSVFWTVLYASPVVWLMLFIAGLFKFHFGWLITVCIAVALNGANLYGYYKCSSDQKAKFQRLMMRGAEAGAMAMIKNNVFGMLSKFSGGAGAQTQPPSNSYV